MNRTETSRPLTSAEFREVIGHFASGVTIITANLEGRAYGSTASAVSSLSLDPPMVLICMNLSSATGQAVAEAGSFAINILHDRQDELARRFASKAPNKFDGVPLVEGALGLPVLGDALATLECDVTSEVVAGTHKVFIAEVLQARSREGSPLAYFRGQFGRLELTQDRQLYETVRKRLLARELPVGRELEPSELASGLDVPAGSLYYALGRLSGEGMIGRSETGGFIVPPVTPHSLDAAVDACAAIELGVIDATIGRVTAEQLGQLRDAMESTLEHVRPGTYIDVDTSIDDNTHFHETLIGFAGSEPLLASYRLVALPGILARSFEPRISSTETDVGYGRDHIDLVEAFEAGDAAAARDAIVRHRERIKSAFRASHLVGG